jgi:beta-galactosidase
MMIPIGKITRCLVLGLALTGGLSAQERTILNFNESWRFQKGDPEGTGEALAYKKLKPALLEIAKGGAPAPHAEIGKDVAFTQPEFADKDWRTLDLPHDWGIEGPFDIAHPGETGKLPWWGVAWYRKDFELPVSAQGRRVFLEVDGAMSVSSVWVNGKFAGGWAYGYASWRVELTPFVKPGGKNVVAIRLDNAPNSSRWYPGGGIYRNVRLVTTAPVAVAQWGVTVTTPEVSAQAAKIQVRTSIDNASGQPAEVRVEQAVYACGKDGRAVGNPVYKTGAGNKPGPCAPGLTTHEMSFTLASPRLWNLETPNLYLVRTTLVQGGKPVDTFETSFGIREAKFIADDGFHLNGKRVTLKGVCLHHDLGALGAAINTRALERQLELLKEMGCNAIRTSHNPPAPEQLALADRMGFVVLDEFSDTWGAEKKPNGYSRFYWDWAELDLSAFIRRDRNHPSVIAWSTGNEIAEQWDWGHKESVKLTAIAHREDPTRPVTAGCNYNEAGFNGFQKTVDVFGYNYKPGSYEKFHKDNPALPVYGSETASTVSSRGVYVFPVSGDKAAGKTGFQVSSYDLYAPPWASDPDMEWRGQDKNPFVAGEFVWTGFDYLGEPTPFNSDLTILNNFHDPAEKARAEKELAEKGKIATPSRSSYFGIIDLAGLKKDRFYLYQARWRPEHKMAHVLPHWTWPGREGQVTPVYVYTSGDEAELFLNGKSLGRKKQEPLKYRLKWEDVKYEPGELSVVAYKGGKEWARTSVKTAGAPAKLLLETDRAGLSANGTDLAYLTATVVDANGIPVPGATNLVKFAVTTGPAQVIATDAGDATSFEPFQSAEKKAFSGKCVGIVRTQKGKPGKVTVTVSAEGLAPGKVELEAK